MTSTRLNDRRAEELRAAVEQGIPFLTKVRVVVEEITPGRVRLRFPHDPTNANYLGTTHAAAIFAFGETCAGLAAGASFDLARLHMVARHAAIEFREPVTGELVSVVEIPADTITRVMESLERAGRASLPVKVTMHNTAGEMAAEMTVEYAFRKLPRTRHVA